MRRNKYKHSFDGIVINNRWSKPHWNRENNWVIFGVYKKWFGVDEYEYQIGLFGITIRIWMKRTIVKEAKKKTVVSKFDAAVLSAEKITHVKHKTVYDDKLYNVWMRGFWVDKYCLFEYNQYQDNFICVKSISGEPIPDDMVNARQIPDK